MSTWQDVDTSLAASPLHSDPGTFDLAESHFSQVRDNVGTVIDRLTALGAGGVAEFQGDAANAFVRTIQDLGEDLRDVPAVAGDIATLFRNHAIALRELKTRVDQALARAITAHSRHRADQSHLTAESSGLRSIRQQLDSMRSMASEDDPQVRTLEERESGAIQAVRSATNRVQQSRDSVEQSIREFHGFEAEQEQLDRQTAYGLNHVNLRGLRNPGLLEKYVGRPLAAVYGDAKDLVEAVWNHDLDAILWKLNDVLKVIGLVLAVVSLVVLAVGLLVPGLNILAGLALAALLVSVAKLAVSTTLLARGSTNFETGEVMTSGEVFEDAVSVVLAGVHLRVGGMVSKGSLAQMGEANGRFATKFASSLGRMDRVVHPVDEGTGYLKDGLEIYDTYRGSTDLDQPYVPPLRGQRLAPPSSTSGPTKAVLCSAY